MIVDAEEVEKSKQRAIEALKKLPPEVRKMLRDHCKETLESPTAIPKMAEDIARVMMRMQAMQKALRKAGVPDADI